MLCKKKLFSRFAISMLTVCCGCATTGKSVGMGALTGAGVGAGVGFLADPVTTVKIVPETYLLGQPLEEL